MLRKSKKKPAQEPVSEQQTEQPPAPVPAAEPIIRIAQPIPIETELAAAKPAETNPIAAPPEAKTAEIAPQPESMTTTDQEKPATETTAAVVAVPLIQADEGAGMVKPLGTDNALAKANILATGRQPIFGIMPKRELPPETDLKTMAPELRDAVANLKHARTDVKIETMFWISNMRNASAAVPSLIRLLNDQEDTVRSNAAWGIGRIGKDAKGAVPFLLDALNDRCCDVRRFAAMALGEIGDLSAIMPLNDLAKTDKDWMLRRAVETALKKLNGQMK